MLKLATCFLVTHLVLFINSPGASNFAFSYAEFFPPRYSDFNESSNKSDANLREKKNSKSKNTTNTKTWYSILYFGQKKKILRKWIPWNEKIVLCNFFTVTKSQNWTGTNSKRKRRANLPDLQGEEILYFGAKKKKKSKIWAGKNFDNYLLL